MKTPTARRTLIDTALAAIVAAAVLSPQSPAAQDSAHAVVSVASSASRATLPQIRASPSTVRAGGTVLIRGSGWAVAGTRCGRVVRLSAFALGISRYAAQRINTLTIPTNGRFTQKWVTAHVSEQYTWGIEARQPCPTKPRVKQVNVVILPG
jgi:hypothetical protein